MSTPPAAPLWPVAPRPRVWPAVAIATLAALLAAAALVVALTRPTAAAAKEPASTPTTPTYTAAEVAVAHRKLCDAYTMAARAVDIETHRTDPALASIAVINGALILQTAVAADPALTASDRSTALALAAAYRTVTAVAATVSSSDPAFLSAVDAGNARDDEMKQICKA